MQPHAGQRIAAAGRPLGTGRVVMVLVHGRGAAPENILDLVPPFAHPEVTYLAPAAAGNTWYPNGFMVERERNEPGLTSALTMLAALVDDILDHGIGRERLVLLGFSQGACLAAEFAVRHPARYGGVIVYSGGLIGPPGTAWTDAGAFAGTPVFLGCSDADAHVPRTRVAESAAVFARMGARVTQRIYPGMGHLVNEEEIAFTRDLLADLLAPEG